MTARLPKSQDGHAYVTVSPIVAGSLTLPQKFFIHPAEPDAKDTVPSLAFLITHPNPPSKLSFLRSDRQQKFRPQRPLRLLFDLGLRRALERYDEVQQKHLQTRAPYQLAPGIAKTLQDGGLSPDDIDVILISHVHHDHHGDPEDFPSSDFVIGNGAWKVLKDGLGDLASHQYFQSGLLPEDRTTELSDPSKEPWIPLGPFPAALDLLGDGSLFVVDAPGHLPGHMSLLARVEDDKWVCLAGDTAHHMKLLTGEKEIGSWQNDKGMTICIHLDREEAEKSIKRLRKLQEVEGDCVDVVLAHDADWAEKNKTNFYPSSL